GPLSRHEGEPVTLRATLRDGDEPLTGITVLARLAVPGVPAGEPIPLVDDGQHDEGEANDGEYAATLNALPSNAGGFVAVRFDADGTNRRGTVFARSGSSSFMNERTSSRPQPNVRATVTDGALHVRANADVVAAGSYRFDVLVASRADAKGERQGIAWGQAVRMLTTGANELSLDVPVDDAKAGDLFLDVRLLSLDSMGVAGRVTREGVE